MEEKSPEKRKDDSAVWLSFVIALVLALCAGFYVYYKNQQRKNHADGHPVSEWNFKGTKLNHNFLNG